MSFLIGMSWGGDVDIWLLLSEKFHPIEKIKIASMHIGSWVHSWKMSFSRQKSTEQCRKSLRLRRSSADINTSQQVIIFPGVIILRWCVLLCSAFLLGVFLVFFLLVPLWKYESIVAGSLTSHRCRRPEKILQLQNSTTRGRRRSIQWYWEMWTHSRWLKGCPWRTSHCRKPISFPLGLG